MRGVWVKGFTVAGWALRLLAVMVVVTHTSSQEKLGSHREDTADDGIHLAVTGGVLGIEEDTSDRLNIDAEVVWDQLQQALSVSSREQCARPPCHQGLHVHTYGGADIGEEMSRIRGAAVVRRPTLANASTTLAPAHSVDFVETLQSYFPVLESSLLRMMLEAKSMNETSEKHVYPVYPTLLDADGFLKAVAEGDASAGEFLTPYCNTPGVFTSTREIDDCLRIPTVVSMAGVRINKAGFVFNNKDYVVPISCDSRKQVERERMARARAAKHRAGRARPWPDSYEKVYVMTQEWGPSHYHFMVEHLPRITVMLDVLRQHEDIKVAVHRHGLDNQEHDETKALEAHLELLELLGIGRERIILIDDEIHADLAILPTSTVCGDPDTSMVNMLRHALLQAMYPDTAGSPPPLLRPVIVLVVRNSIRGLDNKSQVKEALQRNFPDHDVVEFLGTGPVRQQLHTFATASLIVAPHGAGLSNMVVSPLHTPVLEIAPIRCPPCFLRLAIKLQHIYARHPGGEWDTHCKSLFRPDVDELVSLVRDLLEAKRRADSADPPSR